MPRSITAFRGLRLVGERKSCRACICAAMKLCSTRDAAESLCHAGFVDVETSVEAAPTVLDGADQYGEFVRNIILQRHLESIPAEELRTDFIAELTEQAAADDPPFFLDYWRLNLCGR